MKGLAQNIRFVKQRIASACRRAGRRPSDVILVAATKTISVEVIRESMKYGLSTFGENRIQEAKKKIKEIGTEGISWHMIGHLQTNKVKEAVELFDLIHSVDSIRLCEALNERASKSGKIIDILLELNLSGEDTKYGFSEREIREVIMAMERYSNLRIMGLMVMTPFSDNPENSRMYFRRLFNIKEEFLNMSLPSNVNMRYLSMGMTQDFEVAIEEGANIVRIGRAIFGERAER